MTQVNTNDDTRGSVTIVKDTFLEFPELYLDVYIADSDPRERAAFAEFLCKARCQKVDLPEDADVVIFTGGADVNPSLYEQEVHNSTHFDIGRDTADIEIYTQCIEQGIPMFGVCRGAQFLHVMNGGSLYQDVNNHNGDHPMYDVKAQRLVDKVSSVHHQMCIKNPDGGMEVLGTSSRATNHIGPGPLDSHPHTQSDVEAYFYRDTCCFGVQGHPEYRGYFLFQKWTLDRMMELFIENPDLSLEKGSRVRRIKPEVLEQRNQKWSELSARTVILEETK